MGHVLQPVFAIGLILAVVSDALPQAMPAPLWRGASRIVLTCSTALGPDVCATVFAAARARDTLPIEIVADADQTDRETVIVSIAASDDHRTLVGIARRALEIDDAEGAARYVVEWDAAETGTAVNDLLTRILPQLSTGGRRLN